MLRLRKPAGRRRHYGTGDRRKAERAHTWHTVILEIVVLLKMIVILLAIFLKPELAGELLAALLKAYSGI